MIRVNNVKPIKFMGKLVPCYKNPKILCVCSQHHESCLEPDQEKLEDKDE